MPVEQKITDGIAKLSNEDRGKTEQRELNKREKRLILNTDYNKTEVL